MGRLHKEDYLPEYQARHDVQIYAVCDPNIERAKEIQKAFNAKYAFSIFSEMLALEELDAVSVCTSNQFHSTMSVEALKVGKHVLCEKPIAVSIEAAREMIQVAYDNRVFLMIGHNQRFMPAHRKAKAVLDSGELGRVLSFNTTFGHSGPENWSVSGRKSWFFNKDTAFIGAIGDLGIHKIDLIGWLLSESIVETSAITATLHKETEVDDNAILLMKTEKGAIGTLTASWTYYSSEVNSTIVNCENGRMLIGSDQTYNLIVEYKDSPRSMKLKRYKRMNREVNQILA